MGSGAQHGQHEVRSWSDVELVGCRVGSGVELVRCRVGLVSSWSGVELVWCRVGSLVGRRRNTLVEMS